MLAQKDQFAKSHALGNDYIILDAAHLSFPLTAEAVRAICHRNLGVGSDGILLLVPSPAADFGVRIFNPDGSEAEKSGNGLRILGKFLYDHGYTRSSGFTVETPGGTVRVQVQARGGRAEVLTVDMGRATFRSGEIPVAGADREVVGEALTVDGRRLMITAVSVGNPHCVIFTAALDEAEVRTLGPKIETHPAFPNRINVQFARVEAREAVSILIWERGAGYTLASGSSSCAVAAAGVRNGLTDRHVRIQSPGGVLEIDVAEDWGIRLRGPASEICLGTLSPELIHRFSTP